MRGMHTFVHSLELTVVVGAVLVFALIPLALQIVGWWQRRDRRIFR
jgi:hypothetical protein